MIFPGWFISHSTMRILDLCVDTTVMDLEVSSQSLLDGQPQDESAVGARAQIQVLNNQALPGECKQREEVYSR